MLKVAYYVYDARAGVVVAVVVVVVVEIVEIRFLKFFLGIFPYGGGMFLEVKFLKNFDSIWGFHPKFLFGNHQFLVISHIDGVSWSDCLPRGVYI